MALWHGAMLFLTLAEIQWIYVGCKKPEKAGGHKILMTLFEGIGCKLIQNSSEIGGATGPEVFDHFNIYYPLRSYFFSGLLNIP